MLKHYRNYLKLMMGFLKLRLVQLWFEIRKIGIFRTLILLALVFCVYFLLWHGLANPKIRFYLAFAYLGLIFSIHLYRKDKRFVATFGQQAVLLFLCEYFFLALPLLIMSLIQNLYLLLAVFLAFLCLIPFLRISVKKTNRNNILIRSIPAAMFEWKSGIRKNFIFLLSVYVLLNICSFFIGAVPVLFYILTVMFSSFFQECEPRNLLEINENSPKIFLRNKMISNSKLFGLLFLFPYVLFVLFHTSYWYIALIEAIMCYCVFLFAILMKYAYYRPNDRLNSNSVFLAIAILSIIIPFLFPVTIFMAVYFYFKSKTNLKTYLHAYN